MGDAELDASTDSLLSMPGASSAESVADETSGTFPSEQAARKVRKRAPRRPVKPALRSSRGRDLKLTVRYKSEGVKDDDSNWTINERRQLLDALKQYGSSDMEKLAQAVPTRSAAAINFFLTERRRRKDRVVLDGACGKRTTQALRILRRALDAKRRRFDRSQGLVQVVASCKQQPFPEATGDDDAGGELPQFEDVYQCLQEVMENQVPAALGPCEEFVMRRLLGTLTTAVASLNTKLDEEREVLRKQLAWAAAQPVIGSALDTAKRTRTENDRRLSLNFPSMNTRMENLKASWNPLRLPPEVLQKQWPVLDNLLAINVFRSERAVSQEKSSASTGTRGGFRREPRPLETFSAWKH